MQRRKTRALSPAAGGGISRAALGKSRDRAHSVVIETIEIGARAAPGENQRPIGPRRHRSLGPDGT